MLIFLLIFVHVRMEKSCVNYFLDGATKKEVGMLEREKSQKGQGLLEYGLLIILVAVLVLVVIAILGPSTGSLLSDALTAF